jgi:endo-1,4-beta-D-glucanase Y
MKRMAQNKSEVKMVINWTEKHMAPERYLREMVCMWLCEGDLMNCFSVSAQSWVSTRI